MKIIVGKIGDKNFEYFKQLPLLLYDEDSIRLKQKEIFTTDFESDYIVVLNNQNIPQARAVLFYNYHLKYNSETAFSVGHFEAVNDSEIVNSLFLIIQGLAKNKQAQYIIGPMNGSTWEQYRFNTQTHNLFFTEFEHKEYYPNLFKNAGFESVEHYFSNKVKIEMDNVTFSSPAIEQMQGVTIRKLAINDFENEIKKIFNFSLEVFKNNFLYTPISWESFYAKYLPIKSIINPDYVLLAEKDNELIGFLFAIHDFYSLHTKNIIVKTIARKPQSNYLGLASILGNHFMKQAQADKYEFVIHAFIHEDNKSQYLSTKFKGDRFKEYELYACKLS